MYQIYFCSITSSSKCGFGAYPILTPKSYQVGDIPHYITLNPIVHNPHSLLNPSLKVAPAAPALHKKQATGSSTFSGSSWKIVQETLMLPWENDASSIWFSKHVLPKESSGQCGWTQEICRNTTHLKDRISSMSLFIPNRAPELILLFTCLVQEGRLCPHWTKVAKIGKYGKMPKDSDFSNYSCIW